MVQLLFLIKLSVPDYLVSFSKCTEIFVSFSVQPKKLMVVRKLDQQDSLGSIIWRLIARQSTDHTLVSTFIWYSRKKYMFFLQWLLCKTSWVNIMGLVGQCVTKPTNYSVGVLQICTLFIQIQFVSSDEEKQKRVSVSGLWHYK